MDDYLSSGNTENGKIIEGRKYHPNAVKDVKRKLSFMNKKISDLHHQRKFAYKNSVKVKKMVHNQVNQIVKCLRSRERNLLSDVDEAFISQDANISDELSRLQSVHARCQVLFNHLADFRGNGNILSSIYSILAEVNFGEKSDIKPLEFISEFEAMKTKASNYGHLEGDFYKKFDFVLVADKEDSGLSGVAVKQFLEKGECCDQTASNKDYTSKSVFPNKFSDCKEADIEDSFQIIDLLDNMCCHDANEDIMQCEEESLNCKHQMKKEFNGTSACETDSESAKVCDSPEYPYEVSKSNSDFHLDEEWKHILEMNKKIADFKEILKPHEEKQIYHKVHNDVGEHRSVDKLNNYKRSSFLLLEEADKWLYNLSSRKDKKSDSINFETNLVPPAELIKKAFKPYLTKDSVKNWLLCK